MLRKLDDGLWVIDHEFKMPGGIQIGTRTTLIRLSDGSLFAHALGPADDGDHGEIAKLGDVTQLVAPNLFHNEFVTEWVERYEGARCYAPPSFDTKVEGLEYTTLTSVAPVAWANDLEQVYLDGAPQLEETVFFHPATRTLLLTDICFNMMHSDSFVTRLVMRIMGGYGHFGPSRLGKSFMKDKAAMRKGIGRILEWDFDRVTVTHGEVLETNGHAMFKQAYAWLLE
ncbi:MAG: DUF4336 domain-containing protein [Myxococcota bacterium]|jgi:hypothetical protein|nr:DUF4336 domain-containing protein [Myxococcota bacterium]